MENSSLHLLLWDRAALGKTFSFKLRNKSTYAHWALQGPSGEARCSVKAPDYHTHLSRFFYDFPMKRNNGAKRERWNMVCVNEACDVTFLVWQSELWSFCYIPWRNRWVKWLVWMAPHWFMTVLFPTVRLVKEWHDNVWMLNSNMSQMLCKCSASSVNLPRSSLYVTVN